MPNGTAPRWFRDERSDARESRSSKSGDFADAQSQSQLAGGLATELEELLHGGGIANGPFHHGAVLAVLVVDGARRVVGRFTRSLQTLNLHHEMIKGPSTSTTCAASSWEHSSASSVASASSRRGPLSCSIHSRSSWRCSGSTFLKDRWITFPRRSDQWSVRMSSRLSRDVVAIDSSRGQDSIRFVRAA